MFPAASLQAAGQRSAAYARDVLARYDAWSRSAEGRSYLAWRAQQLQLPEAQRQTGLWGQSQGLNGYLRGNEPKHLWARRPAGEVWKFRCNVFAWDAAYAGGYAVPSFMHPDTLAHKFLKEEQGTAGGKERVHDYFQRVPDITQARPGDWLVLGNPKGGGTYYGHVVLVTGPFDGTYLPVAQASSNPRPESTRLRFQDGRPTGYYKIPLLLRPTHMRPTDPHTGQPVHAPTALG